MAASSFGNKIKQILNQVVGFSPLHHLAFWGLSYYVLLRMFMLSSQVFPIDYIYTGVFHISLVLAVYINVFLLIPRLLKRQWLFIFLLAIGGNIVLFTWLHLWLFDHVIDTLFPGYYFISYYEFDDILLFHLVYVAVSSLLKLSKEWFLLMRKEKEMEELAKEKVKNELQALKSQVNPHFLFNTLHNIYSLSLKKSEDTPAIILKLSDLLRYVLYETSDDVVELRKEIAFLTNYMELQRIRAKEADIQFKLEGDEKNKMIAPLLFVPLIENSFKHGLKGDVKDTFVYVTLKVSDHELQCIMVNNKGKASDIINGDESGIGLENVRRRLELIYPKKHTLKIHDNHKTFKVELSIQLDEANG